ncbi:MAG TPA: aldehyde dehydrogenase family protein, partial [Rubrobacter sp.]|nr:aldehyde dehydrogenase family protein [Rubrobacter sp.]
MVGSVRRGRLPARESGEPRREAIRVQVRHREVRNLIGGSWESANGKETEPVYDPATAEVIAQTPLSTREDVERAVQKASQAFPEWAATPV